MNRLHCSACATIAALLVATIGCKPPATTSDTRFDARVSEILNLNALSPSEKEEICSRSALIVFVGNAEPTNAELLQGSLFPPPRPSGEPDLKTVVRAAAEDLRQSLRDNDQCRGTSRPSSRQGGVPPAALLVTIVDGPGPMDSEVRSTWYSWDEPDTTSPRWGIVGQADSRVERKQAPRFDRWLVNRDGVVAPNTDNNSFEIHLPTQLSSIIDFFAKQRPPGQEYENFVFDQKIYLIKSHGGRFLPKGMMARLLDAILPLSIQIVRDAMSSHTLLFDPHAPGGQLMSAELYNPFWLPSVGCEQIASNAKATAAALSDNPNLCKTCFDILKSKNIDLGAFKSCGSMNGTAAANGTLGEGGGTLGEGGGTLGEGGGTLGEGGGTLGDGGGTLGGDGSGTLGAGKSYYYQDAPEAFGNGHNPLFFPSGAYRVASAASYDTREGTVPGIYPLRLASGEPPRSGKFGPAPTLLVLDSCYGSSQIAATVSHMVKDKTAPVVVVSNPKPVQSTIVNYGALNYTQYVMMPHVESWASGLSDRGPRPSQAITRIKNDIELHMEREGILDSAKVEAERRRSLAAGQPFILKDYVAREAKANKGLRTFNFSVVGGGR